jgi:hypothetical protein
MFAGGRAKIAKINAIKLYESQQGFIRKKRRFLTRHAISKRDKEKYNKNCFDQLPKLCFADYSRYYKIFGILFASHRSNWWLLDIYCIMINSLIHIKSELRN